MNTIKILCLGVLLLTSALLQAQVATKWTNKQGQSFTGRIIDCNTEIGKFKIQGKDNIFEIPLSQFIEEDQRKAILTVYKKKYERALSTLDDYLSKIPEKANPSWAVHFLKEEHLPYLYDIGVYLQEYVKDARTKYISEGEFNSNDDYKTKVMSGMMYFADDWLIQLTNESEMLKKGESTPPRLKHIIKHIKDFHQFFKETIENKDYLQNRLGHQYPVKFKPKDYILDYQPYHYWAYLPKDYDKKPLPVVMFLCGKGQYGTSLEALLTNNLPKMLETRDDYPFIVIAVQDNDSVSRPPYFNEVLDDVKKRFNIDPDKVIATGLSSGGLRVMHWAMENSEEFAGIIPVAAVIPFEEIKQLKNMPIWTFCNEYDNVWIQEIAITYMKEINPNFKYTIFEGAKGHNAWESAYKVPNLEQWIATLDRKNISNNSEKILDKYKIINDLTQPQVKTVPMERFLYLSYDTSIEENNYSDIKNEHSARYGSTHDDSLFEALTAIYKFQHFELKQLASPLPVRFIDTQNPKINSFGVPIKGVQKIDIKPPFTIEQKRSFKCFSAFYVSPEKDPYSALNTLREQAQKAGHKLTGKDRIVYLQMLFADTNIYELQIGIE